MSSFIGRKRKLNEKKRIVYIGLMILTASMYPKYHNQLIYIIPEDYTWNSFLEGTPSCFYLGSICSNQDVCISKLCTLYTPRLLGEHISSTLHCTIFIYRLYTSEFNCHQMLPQNNHETEHSRVKIKNLQNKSFNRLPKLNK